MAAEKKEMILLDAEIVSVLACSAFRARLENHHGFVAITGGGAPPGGPLGPGDRVRVAFSPYDMSTGRIEDVLERTS